MNDDSRYAHIDVIIQLASFVAATILVGNSSCLLCRLPIAPPRTMLSVSRFVLEVLGGVHESVHLCYEGAFFTGRSLRGYRPQIFCQIDHRLAFS